MTYNKPELAVIPNAMATIKGDKEDPIVQDGPDPNSPFNLTINAYQADE
jgi:hypothetical protein